MARISKNARLGLVCVVVFAGMTGAAFAAVPLYRAFCQATGFDGTVKARAAAASTTVSARSIGVRFDGNVRDMPWTFGPEQVTQTVKLGETRLAYFKATNTGSAPVTGRALFNVTPEAAGGYFHKVQCFCFDNQTIQPGQTVEFPVVYYVDPKIADDPDGRGVAEITLSYTFYPAQGTGKPA